MTVRKTGRTDGRYAVYDGAGAEVGWLVQPEGTPTFGANAPAVLLQRAL